MLNDYEEQIRMYSVDDGLKIEANLDQIQLTLTLPIRQGPAHIVVDSTIDVGYDSHLQSNLPPSYNYCRFDLGSRNKNSSKATFIFAGMTAML